MKRKIRITAAIICIMLLTMATVNAETIRPRYVTVGEFSCSLNISSGRARCMADVMITEGEDYTSCLSATLMRSSDGRNWSTVRIWSSVGSGTLGVSIDATIKVASGYKYKLLAKATIKNNSGAIIETVSKSSGIVNH